MYLIGDDSLGLWDCLKIENMWRKTGWMTRMNVLEDLRLEKKKSVIARHLHPVKCFANKDFKKMSPVMRRIPCYQ